MVVVEDKGSRYREQEAREKVYDYLVVVEVHMRIINDTSLFSPLIMSLFVPSFHYFFFSIVFRVFL